MHEQRPSLLAAETKLVHRLAHPREVGVAEIVKNDECPWRERRLPRPQLLLGLPAPMRAVDIEQVDLAAVGRPAGAWSLHEGDAPAHLRVGQLRVAVALGPIDGVVADDFAPRVVQREGERGPARAGSELGDAAAATCEAQQQRKVVWSRGGDQAEPVADS